MKLVKRNKIFWVDFTIAGKRFRLSTNKTDAKIAKEWAKEKISELSELKNTSSVLTAIKDKLTETSRLSFEEAWEIFHVLSSKIDRESA